MLISHLYVIAADDIPTGNVILIQMAVVMAEFSKWLEAGEESVFSLETEKNLPGASCELREAAARTKNPQK